MRPTLEMRENFRRSVRIHLPHIWTYGGDSGQLSVVTGHPYDKIYFMLLRDRKGFEKKVRQIGFIQTYLLHVPRRRTQVSACLDPSELPELLELDHIVFEFSNWMNNSVALYLERNNG